MNDQVFLEICKEFRKQKRYQQEIHDLKHFAAVAYQLGRQSVSTPAVNKEEK